MLNTKKLNRYHTFSIDESKIIDVFMFICYPVFVKTAKKLVFFVKFKQNLTSV